MRIQHNIMAMNAYRNYTTNTSALSKNLEKLSSGYKINRAGDDAAGLAISEKMRAQITGLETAQKNAKDGISLVQTAEGALTEVHDMLNRMVELANQSANGTYDNETDRDNLQKEMDQLRSEINRIADSANFNGINLLDGSLGLNSSAFDISSLDAIAASDGVIKASDLFGDFHAETAAATGVDPSATIDLGDLKVNVAGKATATVDISLGDKTVNVKLQNTGSAAKDFSVGDIATALASAIKSASWAVKASDGTHDPGNTNNNAIKLGDHVYTVGATANGLTLTYAGSFVDGKFTKKSATAGDFTESVANSINAGLGFSVSSKVTNGTVTGSNIHASTQVNHAVAKKDASLAGVDLELTAAMIVEGGKLTIDGKEFVFKVDKDSTLAGGNVIDVSKATTDEERIHMAADLLSKQTITGTTSGREYKIGVSSDGVIHIEQTKASKSGEEIESAEDFANLIKIQGKLQTAENAGTKIAITDANVKSGDTLTIDGKKFIFTDDAEKAGTKTGDVTYVGIEGGAAKNLSTMLQSAGIDHEYDEDANTIEIRAAKASDDAPQVLGAGLTLQIGDTSDDWNQLNVLVQDMHVDSLGIDKIKISDQVSAQDAVSVIKDAINMVSSVRGTLGATQNRLDHTINNLSVMTENIQDAESTIRDTDVAEEMMAYTKNNILVQSAQAMLAQANQVPQGVLQLLQ